MKLVCLDEIYEKQDIITVKHNNTEKPVAFLILKYLKVGTPLTLLQTRYYSNLLVNSKYWIISIKMKSNNADVMWIFKRYTTTDSGCKNEYSKTAKI